MRKILIPILLLIWACVPRSEQSEDLPFQVDDGPIEQTVPETFTYNVRKGKCLNKKGMVGYNPDVFEECGDLSNRNLSFLDWDKNNIFGLNLESSILNDHPLDFHHLSFQEVRFNKHNQFAPEIKSPFSRMFISQYDTFHGHKKKLLSLNQKINALKSDIDSLKQELKKQRDKKKKKKLKSRLNRLAQLKKTLSHEAQIYNKRKNRIKGRMGWVYRIAAKEPHYDNITLKNNNWASLDGKSSFKLTESMTLMEGAKNFTISLWFRTNFNQNDKRLINLHRSDRPGSAINLSLKNSRIALGIHNLKRYISIEHSARYYDGKWHHLAMSYHKKHNLFILYFDGQAIKKHKDSFIGLGRYPASIGSYNGSNRFYRGDIDEISIWAAPLNAKDIRILYNNAQPTHLKLHRLSAHLLHWWRLGDHPKDSEMKIHDQVGNVDSHL